MNQKKPINHPKLGGDVVDLKKELPQRKPNSTMSGEELLRKAAYGTPKPQPKNIFNGK